MKLLIFVGMFVLARAADAALGSSRLQQTLNLPTAPVLEVLPAVYSGCDEGSLMLRNDTYGFALQGFDNFSNFGGCRLPDSDFLEGQLSFTL